MPETLDYASSAPRSRHRPLWTAVLSISSVASGFVSWGIAASARNGPLPGELVKATILAAMALLLLVVAGIRLIGQSKNAWAISVLLPQYMCLAIAALLTGLAVWNLIQDRW